MNDIKRPLIVPFDEWLTYWSEKDIEDFRKNFEGYLECPSCKGDGTIRLEHTFEMDGKEHYKEYEVTCELCDGRGELQPEEVSIEQLLKDEYENRLAIETEKYYNYMREIKKTNNLKKG